MKTSYLALGLVMVAAGLAGPAVAADYPTKPIKMIVPYAAGASTDVLARLVAESLAKSLGQPVIVENHSGGGGLVGAGVLSRAEPDGYTVGVISTSTHVLPAALGTELQYDPSEDFTFIGLMASYSSLLAVKPELPIQSIEDYIAYAKERPGELMFASSGVGASLHLLGELYVQSAGIDVRHVPFDGGAAALTGVMGDSGVQSGVFSIASGLDASKQGLLRAIGIFGDARHPALPDVPTIQEVVPSMPVHSPWFAIAAPSPIPDDIAETLNARLVEAMSSPEVHEKLAALGYDVKTSTRAEVSELIDQEVATWTAVVKNAGISVER